MAFNQSKYANDFAKQKYDRLNIQVPKGQKAVIEEHWRARGYTSLNSYVNDLIKKDMATNPTAAIVVTGIGDKMTEVKGILKPSPIPGVTIVETIEE